MKKIEKMPDLPTDEQVALYLKQHPFFFCDRDDLLLHMQLPHQCGEAISLFERQVSLLRQRNMEIRQRLHHILHTANTNDRLLHKIIQLVFHLYEAKHLDQLQRILEKHLFNELKTDYVSLIIISDQPHTTTCVRIESTERTEQILGTSLTHQDTLCGHLRDSELAFLFPIHHKKIQSAAMVPVCHKQQHALLAVGSEQSEHYQPKSGLLFLNVIGQTLGRMMEQLGTQ